MDSLSNHDPPVCFSPHNHYTNGHSKTKKENPPRRLIEIFSVKGYSQSQQNQCCCWTDGGLVSLKEDAAIFPLYLAADEIARHIIHCLEKLFKIWRTIVACLITLGQLIWFCLTSIPGVKKIFMKSRRVLSLISSFGIYF